MLKIMILIMSIIIGGTTVGCSNNQATVEPSSSAKQEETINKDIDAVYNYIKTEKGDLSNDETVYELKKVSDGVLMNIGMPETLFESIKYVPEDEAVSIFEDTVKEFDTILKYIEVDLRKNGIDVNNVNIYMDIYTFNDERELTNLLYSVSTKDGVILNDVKRLVQYYQLHGSFNNSESKDNKNKTSNTTNNKTTKSKNTDTKTNSDDTRTSEEKHWDEHNSDTSKPPTTVVYHRCPQCGEEKLQNEMFKNGGDWYCNSCGLMYCDVCGRRVYPKWLSAPTPQDYMHYQNYGDGDIVCGYCYNQD